MKCVRRSLSIALAAALVLASGLCSTTSADEDVDVQALKDSTWWDQAQKNIRQMEYEITWQERTGGFRATNRAQKLRGLFRSSGVELVPRTCEVDWCWGLELARFGREGATEQVERVEPTAKGVRLEYTRPGLIEWYENRQDGIEHGFVISEPPAGEGPIVLEGRITGDLKAQLDESGAHISLRRDDVEILRYGKLLVLDADNRELTSRLSANGETIAIVIEEEGQYPIFVDPILTSSDWPVESDQAGAWFGRSVAGAGDVNQDGYPDIIVGADGYNDEGAAFVYYGGQCGPSATPDWIAYGDQNGAQFGNSVAGAGDVNGDGIDDVVIGALGYDFPQHDNAGRVFVYAGDPTGLSATADWTFEGSDVGGFSDNDFGNSVACAGDVNGDGVDDLIIGAQNRSEIAPGAGTAFVYHGSFPGGPSAPYDWIVEGVDFIEKLGVSVAGAGDLDGDGIGDVIVGASGAGRAHVFYGSFPDGLSPTPDRTFQHSTGSLFGDWVAGAGDVDDDGCDDVMIGAPYYFFEGMPQGRAFVYYGDTDRGSFGSRVWAVSAGQLTVACGHTVAGAGDMNGDGFDDVIVGVPGQGRVYVYYGDSGGLSTMAAWFAETDQPGSGFGTRAAGVGDVDGDGYDDVVAGALSYDNPETSEGRAYLYLGYPDAASGPPLAEWVATCNQAEAGFGQSVAGAGDVNGDGYSDVIVGAYQYDAVIGSGRAFVFLGSPSGPSPEPDWFAEGSVASQVFGWSVACAGDVDNDGFDDVVVGSPISGIGSGSVYVFRGKADGAGFWDAPYWDFYGYGVSFGRSVAGADVNGDEYSDIIVGAPSRDALGKVYVFCGSPAGIGGVSWDDSGELNGDDFGYSVANAGDVDGNGIDDIIVGASENSENGSNAGKVYVYHGGPIGLSESPDWTAVGESMYDYFGRSVAGAGDVNGDNVDDVIVGASVFADHDGKVYLYEGQSGTGLSEAPIWTALGEGGDFGTTVAGAGNVNGDAFDDLIVGAYRYANGEADEGKAYVYLGGPGGPSLGPDWTEEGNQVDARFGVCVAGAGDVNGDGLDDVVIGADGYSFSTWPCPGNALSGPALMQETAGARKNEGGAFLFRGIAEPVPVELAGFEATSTEEGVLLKWSSTLVSDLSTFFVHRSTGAHDGGYFRVNERPIEGTGISSSEFSYLDTDVVPGTLYHYKLEVLEGGSGRSIFFGPYWNCPGLLDTYKA